MSSGFSDAECIDGKCKCVKEICDTKKQDRDSHEAKKKLHEMKQSETAKNHEAKHESKTNKHKCKKYVPCEEQSHCIYDTNSAGDCREFCMSSGFSDAECIDGALPNWGPCAVAPVAHPQGRLCSGVVWVVVPCVRSSEEVRTEESVMRRARKRVAEKK
ncbi:hypothetical protein ACFX13_018866 [Malus domestica]